MCVKLFLVSEFINYWYDFELLIFYKLYQNYQNNPYISKQN